MRSVWYRLYKKWPPTEERLGPTVFHFQALSQLSFANLRVLECTALNVLFIFKITSGLKSIHICSIERFFKIPENRSMWTQFDFLVNLLFLSERLNDLMETANYLLNRSLVIYYFQTSYAKTTRKQYLTIYNTRRNYKRLITICDYVD